MINVQWRRRPTGPIGIDVGTRCVRAVQLIERPAGCALAAVGTADLPPGAERDPAAQQAVIARLLGGHGFSGKAVSVSLPASAISVKNLRLPPMPDEELAAAAEFEARERFADLAGATLRILPAGLVGRGKDEQQEVIVLAARSDAIDARLKLFTSIGLRVTFLEPGTQAFFRPFARFLERAEDAERASAFVDVGARGARILIARGGEIAFLKTCTAGGEALDRAVAEALGVPIEQANVLRRRVMVPGGEGDAQYAGVLEAIGPVLDQLGKEISLCLRYYSVTFRGDRPDSLTGSGTELAFPAVTERLTQSTQLSVKAGDTLRGIDRGAFFSDATDRASLPEWTTAIGLALRGQRRAQKSGALPAAKTEELKVA